MNIGRRDDALWWLILGPPLGVPIVLTLLGRVLPAQAVRTGGQRVVWFPYRRAGALFLVGAVGLGVAAGVTANRMLLKLGLLAALGGLGAREIARRRRRWC